MNDIVSTSKNEFGQRETTTHDMMVNRQAQEIQAAMVIAKKFPRDEATAFDRIMRACGRKGLAEQAEYSFPRGGTKVVGASIRLAEAIAQCWGNIDYGIIELENKDGKSEMMAYAWDLETNTRVTKIFTVQHVRDTKKGSYALTDSRDIYEATANFGSRRVRACILGVIPGDVEEAAIQKCRETIKGSHKTPLADRVRLMISQFEESFMVGQKQIEGYLGCNISAINESELGRMAGVYRSIRDGMASVSDFFNVTKVDNPFPDGPAPEPENQDATAPKMGGERDMTEQEIRDLWEGGASAPKDESKTAKGKTK